jgi:purine nucleosidase
VKVLLDTDPGSDIDDAIAMAYLASRKDCELLGVTTVSGDVRKRAAIAEIVLRSFGRRDVPIAVGASEIFLHGPGQPNVPQYEFVSDLPHSLAWRPNAAVDLLRKKIKEHAGEVTLITIGPLTNAAILLLLDPEIVGSLKQVISMAGYFHFGEPEGQTGSEWNVECDPVASAIFFNRCKCPWTLVPLDVTMKCQMMKEDFRKRFAKSPHDVILKMTTNWFKGTDRVTFHDPLACALAFHPELCTYETGRASANPENGFTTLAPGGTDRVAKTVDAPAFFEEYFRVVG